MTVRRAAQWIALGAATAAAAIGLSAIGLPSPSLFAALVVGLVCALALGGGPDVPAWGFRAAQAVTGVALGAYVQSAALREVSHAWLPVLLTSAATLVLSLGCGLVLQRAFRVDPATAALGMVAGGASGIVGMAGELGADDRLVAFMQYVRVLVVVLLTPLLVGIAFGAHGGGAGAGGGGEPVVGSAQDWGLTLGAIAAGGLAARAVRLPAGSLLGPMIVTAAVALAFPGAAFRVPALLREPAFAAIGLQVGLRFTPDTVREAGRLLLPTLGTVAVLLLACFGLAIALNATTDASLLDAYLATTPGGLYAVLAAAFGSGADTTFIVAVQALRLFVMILLAPVAVRLMLRDRFARVREPA